MTLITALTAITEAAMTLLQLNSHLNTRWAFSFAICMSEQAKRHC
jgi:hypothetical protein